MKALVEPSGRVAQVEEKEFPVAPPLKWVDCDTTVQPEYEFKNGKFKAPDRKLIAPRPRLDKKRATIEDLINELEARGIVV